MLTKQYAKNNKTCKVTFELPAEAGLTKGTLVGDFNNWDVAATPLKLRKDGALYVTVSLSANNSYRFRYRSEDGAWYNDWAADSYAANEFGTEDSVVTV